MIVPSAAVSAVQPVQQNANTAVVGVPTETSLMSRIPFRAVPATISNSEVFNNTRSSVPVRDSKNTPTQSSFAQAANSTSALRRASTAPRYGYSTMFMAQVMGQSGGNDNLVRAFYDAESLFSSPGSEVKHLPSNASKPSPVPQGNAKLSMPMDRPAAQEAAIRVKPNSKPIVVNIPDDPMMQKVATTNRVEVAAVSQRATPVVAQPVIKTDGSLVRSQGAQAYQDTFSRNMLDMADIEPDTVEVSI